MSRYIVLDVTADIRDREDRPVNPRIETSVISGQGFDNTSRGLLRLGAAGTGGGPHLARVRWQKSGKAAIAADLRHVEILL
jgi:hypothetical protein